MISAYDKDEARQRLNHAEINQFIEMTGNKMPEMLLPMQLVCSTGMRRIQLVRLKPNDYVKGRLTITLTILLAHRQKCRLV